MDAKIDPSALIAFLSVGEPGSSGPGHAHPGDVARLENTLNAPGPGQAAPLVEDDLVAPPAKVDRVTPGDKILGGLVDMSASLEEKWQGITEIVGNGDVTGPKAVLLAMAMHDSMLVSQLFTKMVSKSTSTVEQLVKTQ